MSFLGTMILFSENEKVVPLVKCNNRHAADTGPRNDNSNNANGTSGKTIQENKKTSCARRVYVTKPLHSIQNTHTHM